MESTAPAARRLLRLQRLAQKAAINLRQLRYFARIVETGDINRAAEQLFVAPPLCRRATTAMGSDTVKVLL